MTPRMRSFWLPAGFVAYVAFASAERQPGAVLPWVALIGLPLLVAEVFRRTARPRDGESGIEPAARSAIRAVVWGIAVWVAARVGPAGRPAFDALSNLGVGVAAVAGLVSLARIGSPGGLLMVPSAARSLDAAAFTGLLWGIAVALPATRSLVPAQSARLDPLAIDYATTTAGLGSLLVIVATAWRLRVLRRLEIGVGDRASGALALSLTALLVAVPAAALDVAPPDRVLPAAVAVAALLATWAATTPEPTTVSSLLRGILAVMMLGAPVTLAAGLFARELPKHAGGVVLIGCTLSILVGLLARAVARPLGPEQSRWLDAIEAASRGALQPEPDAAIRAALVALGGTSLTPSAKPELWRNDPEEVLTVDVAGYLHVEKATAPERIYELALAEPERTLRAEVLRALEVRRTDVRPLLAWFENRRGYSATLVLDEDGPLGFILLPRGNRNSPMTLEEARAVRLLADRISSLLAVSSALARSRERELLAIGRADKLDDERQRLEHIIARDAARNETVAESAARAVRVGIYSAAARFALDQIERLGRSNVPLSLVVPLGGDAVGWSAIAHLASPRRGGPFIVVYGTRGAEHEPERWEDPERSPLKLADGGTLCIEDVAALPLPVQEQIARTLGRSASAPARSSILAAGIVVSSGTPLEPLVEQGRLSRALLRWIGSAEVRVPSLVERAEDLRSLILDSLGRSGLRLHAEPLGIDPAALRLLMEHRWPGNELELDDVLTRVAAHALGRTVSAADLAAIGFRPELETPAGVTPMPAPSRRRPPPRASRH